MLMPFGKPVGTAPTISVRMLGGKPESTISRKFASIRGKKHRIALTRRPQVSTVNAGKEDRLTR